MRRHDIHKLMGMLDVEQIADRPNWVSSQCPFAHWTHDERISNRNSFGVSIGESSFFHCFSCGKTGMLTSLPTILFLLSNKDWVDLRKFIFEHEKLSINPEEYKEHRDRPKIPKFISEQWMKEHFVSLPSYKNLTRETLDEWLIHFDNIEGRVVIPIRDSLNRIVGVKGRAVQKNNPLKYRLYNELNPVDPKKYGVWFGMQHPLVPNKGLFLIESELGCVQLKQTRQIHNVWAVMGVGVTKEQIDTLSNVSNPLIFFFDNDKAGMDLKEKLHKKLKGLTTHYEVTDYCGHKDAGEILDAGHIWKAIASIKIKV